MTAINLVGLSPSDPVPGNYAEIDFAQGPSNNNTGVYAVLVVGGMLSGGSATPDTQVYGPDTTVSMSQESDWIALFGEGSELHRMLYRFSKVNTTTPIYAIAVSEGESAAAATGTITFATTATGAATCVIWIADQSCNFGVATGDTPTAIAVKAVAAINALLRCPVTASNSLGVVTITTKQKGLRANFVRYYAQIRPSSIGTTVTPTASTLTSGGTASDSNALALSTIVSTRYYYLVSAAEDGTQLDAFLSQVNTQALATNGIRQRLFGGSQDTIANAITITTGLNGARAELTWLAQSDVPPCELAANAAAVYSLEENVSVPRLNFDSYGNDSNSATNWKIPAPMSGASPTPAQIAAALNAGITPIGVNRGGSTYLVSRITTRWLNGEVVDYRVRDAGKVTVPDRWTDDLLAKLSAQFNGKTIADDPVGNGPTPDDTVVTPRMIAAAVNQLTRDYGANWLLQNVAQIIAGTIVQRETSPSTRISTLTPLQPADVLHQIANLVLQVA